MLSIHAQILTNAWPHREDDRMGGVILSVRPYIMDLQAKNGTFINGERIEDMVCIAAFNTVSPSLPLP